jgi:hypothetical protein
MRMRFIALILMISVAGMQASAATMAAERQAEMAQTAGAAQVAASPQTAAAAPAAATGTIDVPAGTKIPLNLVTQIMSKSTKPGATVRAVVAFPVTVGNQLAIPAGTYVEGQLVSATAKSGKKTRYGAANTASSSGLQIHFTKLVYANGYTVLLDAQNTDASVTTGAASEVASADELQMPVVREHGPDGGAAFIEGQIGEPLPPLPPLPKLPGPNPVAITLGAIGGFVLITIGAVLLAKHSTKSADAVLYDAGWQFSMALTSALKLDKSQVVDAARMAPAS